MNRKQRRAQGKAGQSLPPSPEVEALFQAALARHRQGQLAEAEQLYRQLLRIDPRHGDALHLLAIMANQTGRHEVALDLVRQAMAIEPRNALFPVTFGAALRNLGREAEAMDAFKAALRLDPANADALASLGSLLLARGEAEDAARRLAEAVRARPNFAKAHSELATALRELGRLEESAGACRTALALDPRNAVALTNLGNALKDLGRPLDAIEVYDRSLTIRPDMAETHGNRGNAFNALRQLDEAIRNFDRALALRPDFAEAHLHRAFAVLAQGDYANGLAEYEWRKRLRTLPGASLTEPEWTGREDLAGKVLFVYAEQGLGDTLQFCRYAAMAADRGARVVLAVQNSLLGLLQGFDPWVQVIGEGLAPVGIDFHCALLSLPMAFGTRPETIPAAPAYIRPDPAKAAAWRERLGEKTRPRIGLVWSGNPNHKNDRNRSIALERLAPLLALDAEFVSLQVETRETDRPWLPRLRDFSAELADFSETAALIDALDLVVAVDTSTAHLAAAMGKPSFILLPFAGDWRWEVQRDLTPWYPTARLFRQPQLGDWDSAIGHATAAVAALTSFSP
jgi:tetratricopeptide (TPR) repeat protein